MSTQPPVVPHIRVSTQQLADQGTAGPVAFEDQDNFVRDLGTVTSGNPALLASGTPPSPVTPSGSAAARVPVLTLPEIKDQCHIESDQTADDGYLTQLEMAARLHTENILRYQIDAAVGENIKQALLLLIGHWYRNRETLIEDKWREGPQAYCALLSAERDYPTYT